MLLLLLLVGFAMNFVGNPRRTYKATEGPTVSKAENQRTGPRSPGAAQAEALRRMDFILARDLD